VNGGFVNSIQGQAGGGVGLFVALVSISRWSTSAHAGTRRIAIAPTVSAVIETDMKLLFIFRQPTGTMARNYSEADSAEHMERRGGATIRRGQ
jgi:hypothetical protein